MQVIIFWAFLAVIVSHVCSLLETTLLAVNLSTLLERRAAGSRGAAHLLQIKRHRIDDAISAILILNTISLTVGSAFAGAAAAASYGEAWVGLVSSALTLVLLVVSEIVPKAMAVRYAGRLSGFVGYALKYLVAIMSPVLFATRALIRLLARRPREHLTRREFTLLVGSAPQEGAISQAESMLIGSLIYSSELTLREVMTPNSAIFMMNAEQTVGDLLVSAEADAFSRIPLFLADRGRVIGYLSHREVLKGFALEKNSDRKLGTFLRPMPAFKETTSVAKAVDQILHRHEAIALVTGKRGRPVGLVTIEDLLEAILGIEITDESEAVARLRPLVARLRRHRVEQLRRNLMQRNSPPA